MRPLLLPSSALAIALLFAPAAQAGLNLVVNGGFESVTGGTPLNGGITGQFIPLTGGFTTKTNTEKTVQIANWNVALTSTNAGSPFDFVVAPGSIFTTGFSDNWDSGYRTIHQGSALASAAYSPVGGNFLMMDADYHPTAITQTISGLVAGKSYTLSFYWAATQWTETSGNTTQDIQATIGNSTLTTATYHLASGQFSGWMQATETFVYEGSNNILSLLAQGGPSGLPPSVLLDGVTLELSVPEPGDAGLLLLGIGGLLVVRRRRRGL